jgi:maltose alpha-D-glucosyltransferase/alpha-amylase
MNLSPDQTWYKDAIIYEVHVRAFCDSVVDGMGDFGGLTQKLDYLQDLGITALWLLPFCPSPLRDDGYDISNYTDVHPAYGTLRDFQRFLREAHGRGLRVITEMVLNHTSDQHVWFQRSRRAAPGTRWRNFYVWSETPEKYRDARIIFKDFETSNWSWDPVAKAYYWHRFYSHQPDLNWDNPEVREAMFAAMDFWFDMGVDGLRLDAVPYLVEREGTNCENLPETHEVLRELRKHVDQKYQDRMLLAEANQWPEDAVAYFGSGDECHMAFHFPLMPRLFMGLRMEDRYPITDILKLTPPIPANCQWAMFLRNHDELTLEMVTDEERDYMYRTYARDREMRINLGIRRRLAPLLENDRRRIELMNALLFSLPGTPVIYYGDEIGMGDNIFLGDRNGVRTPMQWSSDRNAGFSRANPQRLYLPVNIDPEYHYETINVEAQLNNSHSLLWFTKRLIQQRKQFRAFGRGTLEFLYPSNRKALAFIRRFQDESVLVVANLSRFAQSVELDLATYKGTVPVEAYGRTKFQPITENPYPLSLGPHACYWFHLQPSERSEESLSASGAPQELPVLQAASTAELFTGDTLHQMQGIIPRMLRERPWFLGKRRSITGISLQGKLLLPQTSAHLLALTVEYSDSDPEIYLAPISLATGDKAEAMLRERPDVVLARVEGLGESTQGVLYPGIMDRDFSDALLRAIVRRKRIRGESGELVGSHTRAFRRAWTEVHSNLEPSPQQTEQCFTVINYGNDFVLKFYRKLEEGVNPGREVPEFLCEETTFQPIPRALGSLDYRRNLANAAAQTCIGTLSSLVPNAVGGWRYTLDHLGLFFEHALAIPQNDRRLHELAHPDLWSPLHDPAPPIIAELLGSYLDSIRVLARRTAELHDALSSRPDIPDFAPEPFTTFYRHGLYHGMLAQLNRSFELLRSRRHGLAADAQKEIAEALDREGEIRRHLLLLRDTQLSGNRIRNHGDYHLSNVLFTGSDWVITNFEGDFTHSLSERRIKRSALRDVATMLRSFHYISHVALFGGVPGIVAGGDAHPQLEKWATTWYRWVSAMFLHEYLQAAGAASYLPRQADELKILLGGYRIERALMEIEYELEQRPQWIRIPVNGILGQLNAV